MVLRGKEPHPSLHIDRGLEMKETHTGLSGKLERIMMCGLVRAGDVKASHDLKDVSTEERKGGQST